MLRGADDRIIRRELEAWLFPLADAGLEPGAPGTAQGLSDDLTTLVKERLGFDLFALHTIVVGAHGTGATVVAFGDVELGVDLPTVESPAGEVFEISMSRFFKGVEEEEAEHGPQLYILPMEAPQRGLVFSLSLDGFQKTSFSTSPQRDRLVRMISEVESERPVVVIAVSRAGFPEIEMPEIPLPDSFLLTMGQIVTIAFEGPPEILDELEASVASFLEEARAEMTEEYQRRGQSPADYFGIIAGYHIVENLAAQATPKRSDEFLSYDIELSERGWFVAMVLSGMVGSSVLSNFRYDRPRNGLKVVVASQDIKAGTVLRRDLIETNSVPAQFLVHNPLFAMDLDIYLGLPINQDVERGAMLQTSDFSIPQPDSTEVTLPEVDPPDQRP